MVEVGVGVEVGVEVAVEELRCPFHGTSLRQDQIRTN